MRISKAQKFEKEQYMIQQEIISLLGLVEEDPNSELEYGFYLYELDRDQEKIDHIMAMIPEIWKYFAHMNITGLLYPEKCKRPWLSIVRGVLKNQWKLRYKPCRFASEADGSIFTMRYFLERRDEDESISCSDLPSRPGTPDLDAIGKKGSMSSNNSHESLCSLDEERSGEDIGRRRLNVKIRTPKSTKTTKSTKAPNYQVDIQEFDQHHMKRLDSLAAY